MIANRFNIDLVKYLSYIFEWNKEDILSDIDYSSELAKGTVEGYTLAIYLMLKNMYKNKVLFMDYTQDVIEPLSYICGTIDLPKSVQENTLIESKVYQNYKVLSLNTPANLSIKFCLDTLLKYETIRGTDFAKVIHKTLNSIFSDSPVETITNESIKYYLNVIGACLESEAYKGYHTVLRLCQLFLEQLYLVDGDINNLSDS